jgi:hypothetical protein
VDPHGGHHPFARARTTLDTQKVTLEVMRGRALLLVGLLTLSLWLPANVAAEEGEAAGWALTAAGFGDDVPRDLVRSGDRMVVAGTFTGWMSLEDDLNPMETNSTANNLDGFVAWTHPNGSWSHGSVVTSENGTDVVDRVGVLPNGDLLIAGRACAGTAGLPCNATFDGMLTLTKTSTADHGFVFLARLSESGVWQWARQLVSEQPIQVLDLSVQGASAFVAVHHQGSVDVDGLEDPVAGSDREAILVVEFDLSGTTLRSLSIQTTQIIEETASLCANRQGEMHLALTYGDQLIAGDFVLTSSGGTDAAVVRFGEGDAFAWATSTDSSDDVQAMRCTTGVGDGVVVVGTLRGEATFSDATVSSAQGIDVWAADVSGGATWSNVEIFGGPGTDVPVDVHIDASGTRILAGTSSAGLSLGTFELEDQDGEDAGNAYDGWLAHLGDTENTRWLRGLGGDGDERIAALSFDANGRWVMAASFDEDLTLDGQEHRVEGGRDVLVWAYAADLDDDGVLDAIDVCPKAADPDQIDLDGDGLGDVCDPDDDGDGVADDLDDCPTGATGWWSARSSDHDEDGCRDIDEDFDDDEDGIFDHNDACPKGPVGWVSTPEEDQEGDGCSDVDTDGDGWVDQADVCPTVSDPGQADLDGDGIGNACDDDADNDGINATDDGCPLDFNAWTSTTSTDHDRDGCRDDNDDQDDDNDGVLDAYDRCPAGMVGFGPEADHDGDGCADEEDTDDDDDGRVDPADGCPRGIVGRLSLALDADGDGCSDAEEDDDDDQDGVSDDVDACARTPLSVVVDGQGCSALQADDDQDGVSNFLDRCGGTAPGLRVDLNGCALPGQGSDGAEGGIGWTATTLLVLSVVVFAAAGWTFFTGRETSYTPSSEEE